MSDHDNPYAAPRSAVETAPAAIAPLPAGVRRYRLDSVRSAALVRRRLLWAAFGFLLGMTPLIPGIVAQSDSRLFNSLTAIVMGGAAAATLVRLRYVAKRMLPAFELLIGSRVVRRVGADFPPAEVLRPEVTAVVESGAGLWLCSDRPVRALLVPKSLEGYDGLRAELATWAPLQSVRGWAAFWRASKLLPQHGLRDQVAGTALESDVSLAHELDAVRQTSSEAWTGFPQRSLGRRLLVVLVVWLALIVLFVAIWQVLQPLLPQRLTVEEVQ
jgi:hypothetical protein